MTDKPVLYSFRRCPYAMRARMALRVSGADYEHREVVLRDKPPELREASPKATVPVLVLSDGTVIEESLDIMHWALRSNDPEQWLDGDDATLIAANDGPFKHHLDRYKYDTRHDSDPKEHRAEGLALLQRLEERLESAAYLGGAHRRLTDIAIFPFVRQFAATDRDWFAQQALPNVQDWLQRLIGSELFSAIMIKHKQWRAADPD